MEAVGYPAREDDMRRLTARTIMTPDVITATVSTPVKELLRLMDDYDVSAVPILDDAGDLVGIVSEGDFLVKQGHADDRDPPGLLATPRRRRLAAKVAAGDASDLMTSPVVTIDPLAPLIRIARTMAKNSVKRLPVVNSDGALIGVVSRSDVIHAFLRPDDEIHEDIERNVVRPDLLGQPNSVSITVIDGVVHLRGVVERRSSADLLTDVVGSIDGVVDVVNEVTYERDDTARRSPVPLDDANSFFPRPFYR